MNLLLLERHELDGAGRARLSDRRAEHLRKVLRVTPGQSLRLGIVGGGMGEGRVCAVEGDAVVVEAGAAETLPPAPWIDLIVALPRPAVLHRVLQSCAAMGVGRLDLVNAWRVEKSFFSSPALAEEAIRRHLWLGAEQGVTTRLPEVRLHRLLVPFVEELATRPEPPARLVAHPAAPAALEERFDGGRSRVEVAIGPEGGWIDRELATLAAAGFRPVSLGAWILRLETAVTAVLAQLELLRRLGAPSRAKLQRSSA